MKCSTGILARQTNRLVERVLHAWVRVAVSSGRAEQNCKEQRHARPWHFFLLIFYFFLINKKPLDSLAQPAYAL
jgi:hypothetical protein